MTNDERSDQILKLEREIALLREELEAAGQEYGLRHPKLIEIAEKLDRPIARLMRLKLEEINARDDL